MQGRVKEILLLVLALAALGIALFTFRGKPTPAPAPTAAAAPSRQASLPDAAEASASGQEQGGEQQGAGDTGSEGGEARRNPFSAPGGPVATTDSEPGEGTDATAAEEIAETVVPASALEEPGLPQKALTLTGVVLGRTTVAIIRQDDQRFFVKVGDQVDRYRVRAIGSREVVLSVAGQEGNVILRMGGRQ